MPLFWVRMDHRPQIDEAILWAASSIRHSIYHIYFERFKFGRLVVYFISFPWSYSTFYSKAVCNYGIYFSEEGSTAMIFYGQWLWLLIAANQMSCKRYELVYIWHILVAFHKAIVRPNLSPYETVVIF